jgi:hypothetical protein
MQQAERRLVGPVALLDAIDGAACELHVHRSWSARWH